MVAWVTSRPLGLYRNSVRAVVDMKPSEGSEENRRKTGHKVQSLFQGALL